MTRTALILAGLLLVFASSAAAHGGPGKIHVSWVSQQYTPSKAGAGARIDFHEKRPGSPANRSRPVSSVTVHVSTGASSRTIGGTTNARPPRPLYPPLPASSPLLKKTQPYGPGSFWYQDGAGHACQYAPDTTGPCFTITGNTAPAVPPLTPVSIAEHVAEQLALSAGQIKTSPRSAGLTGAPSWFWLDPAPATERLSVSLAGEAVTVTAIPQIAWRFGDGGSLAGGAGVPFQSGPVPSTAITHVYGTRCLPGDQGHDPYVLSSCGSDGYQLVAAVTWNISYRANGPIAAAGALPTRTTTSSAPYPVSEARAFLVGGTAG
jgi:hypothetical protein